MPRHGSPGSRGAKNQLLTSLVLGWYAPTMMWLWSGSYVEKRVSDQGSLRNNGPHQDPILDNLYSPGLALGEQKYDSAEGVRGGGLIAFFMTGPGFSSLSSPPLPPAPQP